MVHLIREFDDSDDESSTSTATRRNEESLAEWEGSFDELPSAGSGTTKQRGRRTTMYDNKHRARSPRSVIDEDDDEVTMKNERILAEWESHFDSLA